MASMIFLDSPCGSGFSYARDPKGYDLGDKSSSLQVVTFLNKVRRGTTELLVKFESEEFYMSVSYSLIHASAVAQRSSTLPVKCILPRRKFICWKDDSTYRTIHLRRQLRYVIPTHPTRNK
jgi:hypothetical protein